MPKWMTAEEAAQLLGVSMRTLFRYDRVGITRPFQAAPRATRRYKTDDLIRALERRAQ